MNTISERPAVWHTVQRFTCRNRSRRAGRATREGSTTLVGALGGSSAAGTLAGSSARASIEGSGTAGSRLDAIQKSAGRCRTSGHIRRSASPARSPRGQPVRDDGALLLGRFLHNEPPTDRRSVICGSRKPQPAAILEAALGRRLQLDDPAEVAGSAGLVPEAPDWTNSLQLLRRGPAAAPSSCGNGSGGRSEKDAKSPGSFLFPPSPAPGSRSTATPYSIRQTLCLRFQRRGVLHSR